MTEVYASSETQERSTDDPHARPGNQNARKHGLFSQNPPPLSTVKQMARDAAEEHDWHLLSQIARHLRDRGHAEQGRKLAAIARSGNRSEALHYADNVLQAHTH